MQALDLILIASAIIVAVFAIFTLGYNMGAIKRKKNGV
jgi:hypothetical protein